MLTYTHCTLCPRRCGVDRTAGQRGFCRMGDTPRAARAAVHYWEEPAIAGSYGAGAVFFSGCTLGCTYCQNQPISRGGFGRNLSPARLREIFFAAHRRGRPVHRPGDADALPPLHPPGADAQAAGAGGV